MANQNLFLANWLKGAYGMELGLAPMLEEQATRLDDDTELHKNLRLHLEKTRQHATLLRDRLQRMGEDPSKIRPIEPVTAAIGQPNGGKPDTARQTELLDYVTESFEIASYRGLQALAELLDDQETSRICGQILSDEMAMTDALSRRVQGRNGHNGHKDAQAAAAQGTVARAREVFAALNAHDLNHLDKLAAQNYRGELPGVPHALGLAETRGWLQGFIAAFPDLHFQLDRVATSDDSTFVEWAATGTHSGPFRMPDGQTIPATNKKVKFDGVTVLRFHNDKLVEAHVISDTGKLMRLLGTMPGVGQAAAPEMGAGRGIVHVEIPALDRRVEARFYNEMFGWEFEHMDEPVNYTTFKSGNVAGGFPDINELNQPGEVIVYIDSEDIEGDLHRAEKLGGKTIVPRTEIPGYGYFAILSDPGGNRVGLYKADQPA